MFLVPKNAEELRRLYESDTPVLAFAFERRAVEDWAPAHSHRRGQLSALTGGCSLGHANHCVQVQFLQVRHGEKQRVGNRPSGSSM